MPVVTAAAAIGIHLPAVGRLIILAGFAAASRATE